MKLIKNISKRPTKEGKSNNDLIKAKEKRESFEEIQKYLKSYEEFKENNKNNTKIDLNFIFKLLEFEQIFDLFESEMNVGYKLKIIQKKFSLLKIKLMEMDEIEALNKLEKHFNKLLAEIHYKRLIYIFI